jgi:hypothetical protein
LAGTAAHRYVIVGGVAAGMSAATRLRRLDELDKLFSMSHRTKGTARCAAVTREVRGKTTWAGCGHRIATVPAEQRCDGTTTTEEVAAPKTSQLAFPWR